jgi:HSP20 family molecular chaperone IbpA
MTEQTLEIQKQDVETTTTIERTHPRRRFIPRADIFENDDAVFLTVDMPGVGETSVDLTLEKNILTIRGEIESILPDDYRLTYREYRVGDYVRTFALSDEVNRDQIEALMKNGVLRVTLPKAEEAKARKIEVRAE